MAEARAPAVARAVDVGGPGATVAPLPQPMASVPPTVAGTTHEEPEMERALGAKVNAEPNARHTLDFGIALGFNSPSGILGLEVEYRPSGNVGFNLGGGVGAWGARLGPAVRWYFLGIDGESPFMEGGLSLNMGGGESAMSGSS